MMLREIRKYAPAVFSDLILDEQEWTVKHIAETIDCDDAQEKVRNILSELQRKGEKPSNILKLLGDDEVYRALFHLKLCLARACKEVFSSCGDLK